MAEMITLRAYLGELGRLLEQEAPTEVISHCRHILQYFPQNVDTYRFLAKALLEKGHQDNLDEYFVEAAEVFRRVLSAVPHDYVAHLGLSEIHDRNEQLDQAIWHLERAYEQMPGNAMLQDALRDLYGKRDGEDQAQHAFS
jgi:tetratricopeptide (TPR) repeat protein